MEQIGYSLIDPSGAEISQWSGSIGQCAGKPDMIRLPNGDDVHCPPLGEIQQWRFVPRVATYGSGASAFDGTNYVVRIPVTEDMVIKERERRLATGFSYNFNDDRGVHVIGTSEQDMKGWSEVTMASQAAMALGVTTSAVKIVTNTGPATVTAQEWQMILLAATAFRQPIWAASFRLSKMNPIPADYAADSYWQ